MTAVPDLSGILAAYQAAKRVGELHRSIAAPLARAMDGALLGVRGLDIAKIQSSYESTRVASAALARIAAEHRTIERGLLGDPAWRAALEAMPVT